MERETGRKQVNRQNYDDGFIDRIHRENCSQIRERYTDIKHFLRKQMNLNATKVARFLKDKNILCNIPQMTVRAHFHKVTGLTRDSLKRDDTTQQRLLSFCRAYLSGIRPCLFNLMCPCSNAGWLLYICSLQLLVYTQACHFYQRTKQSLMQLLIFCTDDSTGSFSQTNQRDFYFPSSLQIYYLRLDKRHVTVCL